MAIRVDASKMHIGVKPEGSWWNEKYCPNVPDLFNPLMDPMEKMDPESQEWGYIGRKCFATKMWAATAAGPFLAEYPPRQKADTLSLKKALEGVMKKLENPGGVANWPPADYSSGPTSFSTASRIAQLRTSSFIRVWSA